MTRPPTPSDPDARGTSPEHGEPEPPAKSLSLKDSFGTAIGASMLGLEQALRDGPPPQIQAAEHMPDQRRTVGTDDVVIDFPELTTEEDGG